MANRDRPVRIPLSELEAVRLLMQVKPTDEMPREGASKKKAVAKKKRTKKTAP